MIATQFVQAVGQFLSHLENVQSNLGQLLSAKRAAMTARDVDQLAQFTQREEELNQRLQQILEVRQRILSAAKRHKLPHESLLHLAGGMRGNEGERLRKRIVAARETAAGLRHESWIHWIIASRSFHHYSELIELIANRGELSPTYSKEPNSDSPGGAVLDASI